MDQAIHANSHVGNDESIQRRRNKRLRQNSSSELSIEELLPDDMGYDADVETVHPDTYEEPESDADTLPLPRRRFFTIDEELAARMKHLGSERSGSDTPHTPTVPRGRKRRSLHEDVAQLKQGRSSDLEVTELVERCHSNPSPPRKKRKPSQRSNSVLKPDTARTLAESTAATDSAKQTDDNMDMT